MAQRLRSVVGSVRPPFADAILDTPDQRLVINLQLDHPVDLLAASGKHSVERPGLRDGAREAVEDGTLCTGILTEALRNDGDDDVIGNELAAVDDVLGFPAKLRTGARGRAQHFARRELRPAAFGLQDSGLCPFSCPRRPKKDQIQRLLPLSFAFRIRPSYCCAIRWLWICAIVSIMTLTMMRMDVPPKVRMA